MFKDLKEYQEITRIYHESVNISEEQRAINTAIAEANFTDEEILYLDENFDKLWDSEFETLTEELIAEQEQLQEMAGVVAKTAAKTGAKLAPKVAKGAKGIGGMLKKGIKAVSKRIPQSVKDTARGAVSVAKSAAKKVGGVLKKAAPFALAGGAFEVGSRVVKGLRDKGKAEREATQGKPDKPIGGGNAGGSTDSGGTQGQGGAQEKKTETKVTETKPKKKMHPIEKKNRARLGDAKVDKLKAKQVDFKAMRKGTMSKDDFIKKYPKSITAQKAAGLRDHTEWDAYDMVLEYLFSTEQVESLEEANYVMMEMDHQTIGEIVKEVKVALSE